MAGAGPRLLTVDSPFGPAATMTPGVEPGDVTSAVAATEGPSAVFAPLSRSTATSRDPADVRSRTTAVRVDDSTVNAAGFQPFRDRQNGAVDDVDVQQARVLSSLQDENAAVWMQSSGSHTMFEFRNDDGVALCRVVPGRAQESSTGFEHEHAQAVRRRHDGHGLLARRHERRASNPGDGT